MKKKEECGTEKFHIKPRTVKRKLFLVGIIVLVVYFWNSVTEAMKPTLMALCKVKSQGLATSIAGNVVQEVMGGLGYLDLITLDRDEKGNILALRANVIEMNKLSSEINNTIQEKYSNLEDMYVKIPLGNFLGNELLARKRT